MGRKHRKSQRVAPPAARDAVPPASRVLAVPAQVLEALAQSGLLEGVSGTRLFIGGGRRGGAMGWFMHQRYPGLQGVFEFETAAGAAS